MTNSQAKRTFDFHIRMTAQERQSLDGIADQLGLTRSELVRFLAQLPTTELKPDSKHIVYLDKRALALIHREMRKQGTNLNQATRAINTIALRTKNSRMNDEELREAFETVTCKLDASCDGQRHVLAKLDMIDSAIFVR